MLLTSVLAEHRVIVAPDIESAGKEFGSEGSPDLVLVDTSTSPTSWTVLRSLRHRFPGTRFLVMWSTNGRAETTRALESGLDGSISKAQPDYEITQAIKDVLSGRIYVPRRSDLDDLKAEADRETAQSVQMHDDRLHANRLTGRQREVLPLLAMGMSNKEIARSLKISEGTTRVHTSSLLRILGARNRTQAAVMAQQYLPRLETALGFAGLRRP
jgi:DNA-binding NarL/FixJ family response regulator